MQRSVRSWTRWSLKRAARRRARTQRRLLTHQLEVDRLLLRLKEQEQLVHLREHRLLELESSRAFHLAQQTELPQVLPMPSLTEGPTDLSQLFPPAEPLRPEQVRQMLGLPLSQPSSPSSES